MANKKLVFCPFFLWRYKESITCENIENHMGFEIKNQLKFVSRNETKDYYEIFCTDRYTECPYYQAIYQKKES